MKVSELAQAGGVTAETVRHYTREGLLCPRRDPHNGYQLYNERALSRLCFIQCFRSLGFGLQEIRDILSQADQDSPPCPKLHDLLADRLPGIHSRIQELQSLADWMDQAMVSWSDIPNAPTGHHLGQLIDGFSSQCCHSVAATDKRH